MRYAKILGFGDIHTRIDPISGLQAIIAIHSTKRGPAIGGCRFYRYNSINLALKDALRLSYMMTLKAAFSDLPHGGAKAVIIEPTGIYDRKAIFRSFGDFIHDINGRYITAMDIGTTTKDMDSIFERTLHVVGASGVDKTQNDPSPFTAKGIFHGLEAAVKFKWDRDNLEGLHVAIQGAGKTAYYLAQLLYQQGVTITVCDLKFEATQRFSDEFQARVVAPEEIYDVECDIFSPAAIGGTINLNTLGRIKASIIAGPANNQLAHRKYGVIAHQRGLLYVPDYVINAGGLIQASAVYNYHSTDVADKLIEKLYDRLLELFTCALRENKSIIEIADLMTIEKINSPSCWRQCDAKNNKCG
ncbi:Glu/Leu/Phe/Val dehydrogenase [Coxiella endosymbiont of Amblyomma sculptum]|uniref:Leu/Phe/Val dehydrogenase n=1 Tax=Coxiella endosymbiont of Amblyomma sculptum TaxID=2487929 RepID=UPI00132F118B|nr:Glu/Leu/Phe/Val dehydrogenase dimerization domain-containing protein [Coxiella endosymbiont of Amblyomma sculptum]QHG92685.1 Glu/Leu/Phe/Val dehydrogenase [Coxiella endosymbiont of Amblyomma sculptum]